MCLYCCDYNYEFAMNFGNNFAFFWSEFTADLFIFGREKFAALLTPYHYATTQPNSRL